MKFEDYKYFLNGEISLSNPWKEIILDMCKHIDKEIRPWYIPRGLLNAIKSNYEEKLPVNNIFIDLLAYYTNDCQITQIKSKFATLQIYGNFSINCKEIITYYKGLCNSTCEFCGSQNNTTHVGIKGWISNLCPDCINKNKK